MASLEMWCMCFDNVDECITVSAVLLEAVFCDSISSPSYDVPEASRTSCGLRDGIAVLCARG